MLCYFCSLPLLECIDNYLQDIVLIGYVGGATGFARYIQNCTNESDITIEVENNYIGGIVGYQYSTEYQGYYNYITINSCKNSGDIMGKKYVGGLLGAGQKVIVTKAILNTNYVTGTISDVESSGLYYGSAN